MGLILPAIAAGLACAAIIIRDAATDRRGGFASARFFIAGAWALCWLAYGINITGFPQPSWTTMLLLGLACAGSLLIVPSPGTVAAGEPWVMGPASKIVATLCVAVALFLIAWDIGYLISRLSDYGWSVGLKIHRLDRMTGTGGFGLPGIEVMRALVCATGVLAFARWMGDRRALDLAIACVGLVAATLGTGRWDIASYSIWTFLVSAFLVRPMPLLRWYTRKAIFVVAFGTVFVSHGQLFGKNEQLVDMAAMPQQERLRAAGNVVAQHAPAAQAPATASTSAPAIERPPTPVTPAATPPPAPAAAPSAATRCERWTNVSSASARFRTLPAAATAVLLYAAGPFAALDRVLCDEAAAVRQVLFYWPLKVLRVLGLRPAETVLGVDPFVDIGVPFNNYSVMYSFVNEIGLWFGPLAWIGLALTLRWFAAAVARSGHPALIVAAAAPLSMGIRTPWSNTYFDGTLGVWLVVAMVSWWAARRDQRAASVR